MNLRYRVVDVLTRKALEGNALAVFPDARGVDSATMQRIARELNLSETTFVLPSSREGCVAQVRIFTPYLEMKFAGHPTIGTSWVLLDEDVVPRGSESFALDELVGPVPIRVDPKEDSIIWLTTPPIASKARFDRARCATALGLDQASLLNIEPELLSAGNPTLFIGVRDKATVDSSYVDAASTRTLFGGGEPTCVFVFCPTERGAYSRMFAPELGVPEDPATGSSTGPLAAYMMKHGLLSGADGTRAVSEQGVKMRRKSELHILIRGQGGALGIDIGGHTTPVSTAEMRL